MDYSYPVAAVIVTRIIVIVVGFVGVFGGASGGCGGNNNNIYATGGDGAWQQQNHQQNGFVLGSSGGVGSGISSEGHHQLDYHGGFSIGLGKGGANNNNYYYGGGTQNNMLNFQEPQQRRSSSLSTSGPLNPFQQQMQQQSLETIHNGIGMPQQHPALSPAEMEAYRLILAQRQQHQQQPQLPHNNIHGDFAVDADAGVAKRQTKGKKRRAKTFPEKPMQAMIQNDKKAFNVGPYELCSQHFRTIFPPPARVNPRFHYVILSNNK